MCKGSEKGIYVKADTIGSLEAMKFLLSEEKIPVFEAGIGNITKKDIAKVKSYDKNNKIILGFNINSEENPSDVEIITDNVIYGVIEKYKEYKGKQKRKIEEEQLLKLTRPCKFL